MEFSVLRTRPCPIANIALLIHQPENAARLTKTHLGFLPSSLSFPKGSVGRTVQHIPSPITCTLDGFSFPTGKNEGGNNNSRSMVGASLALACALGIISCSGMMHHKAFAAWSTASSTTMEMAARTNIEVKTAMDLLMPSRGADEAEKYLKKKIKAHNEDNEAGYYARVALAEVLMHRGKYKEAAQQCQILEQNPNYHYLVKKDKKFHLMQMFIYGMLNEDKKVKQYWKNFKQAYKTGLPL
ncbi:hypothetical protein CK203_115294 [Vitis vinifera]|uniref:Uncharacterized protein n=1 Tax=Vitis vinifera TaxID=29760 RepID=A0A438FCY2_VITVI|nr:hypothetical protein CK203_115294 [Vitis vinifera]